MVSSQLGRNLPCSGGMEDLAPVPLSPSMLTGQVMSFRPPARICSKDMHSGKSLCSTGLELKTVKTHVLFRHSLGIL